MQGFPTGMGHCFREHKTRLGSWVDPAGGGRKIVAGEIRKLIPPGGNRAHTFCSLERDGLELWVDLTDARKKKGHDSAHLYRLKDGKLILDRYVRISLLRKEGVC